MMSLIHNMLAVLAACFGGNAEVAVRGRMLSGRDVELRKTGYAASCGVARLHKLSARRQLMKTRLLMMTLYIVSQFAMTAAQAITPPGTVISNTAGASFDIGGSPISIASNPASVTSTIIGTSSAVALYQYDPVGPGALSLPFPTQYNTAPTPATFVASPAPVIPVVGGTAMVLDPNTPADLAVVDTYTSGEPVFVVVTDPDQNLNPAVLETILVDVTSSTGDVEQILLTETGVNTGEFIGYVQSVSSTAGVTPYEGNITLEQNSTITVSYTDQYDSSDTSIGSTLADPFGIVFDSGTGAPVSGVQVTLLDALGAPAVVYGDDGVAGYPNTVTTGSSVAFNGIIYNFPAGAYRFPQLVPGNYQLVVSTPANYQAPSTVSIANLQVLPGAPFALLTDASFGNQFTLQAGPPLHVDIPVDSLNSLLVLSKDTSTNVASIGDFVKYNLQVENRDAVATAFGVTVTDALPTGFRYQPGSVRYNGTYNAAFEPTVSADGQTLTFNVGNLAPASAPFLIDYVTEITVAAKMGIAINSASAADNASTQSNSAVASITVKDELFSQKSFIAGTVIHGECGQDDADRTGLKDIKLYLEDGTSVVTDSNGKFHFQGVEPGSHVVQIDTHSIPDSMEIASCENNTRFAGTAYSQFVDVSAGSLWRADFYIRNKPPITDYATIDVKSELIGKDVKYTIAMSNGSIPVSKYRLMVNLPKGIEYVVKSSWLDGVNIEDPIDNDNLLIYRLGDKGSNWSNTLEFRARLKVSSTSELTTTSFVMLNTDEKRNIRSKPIKTKLEVVSGRIERKRINYQALFKPLSAELTEKSARELDQLIDNLGGVEIELEKVVGHSDSIPIRSSRAKYKSNKELSKARAQSVADHLISKLNMKQTDVEVVGMGSSEPVASNKTAEGRARNRRVELFVNTSKVVNKGSVNVVESEDTASRIEIQGGAVTTDRYALPAMPEQKELNIDMFDAFWLKTAKPGTEWLMPAQDYYAEIPAINIAIKHAPDAEVELLIDGEKLNPLFYFGTLKNKQKTVARSYWQGVHIHEGENRFTLRIKDKNGKVLESSERVVTYAGAPARVELVEEYSRLIADGVHTPVIALRFTDKDGYYARPGVNGIYQVNAPYISKQVEQAVTRNRLTGLNRNQPVYKVNAEGLAIIELNETTRTGRVEIKLPLANGDVAEVEAWLKPDLRDWIMVGLAETTVGYNKIRNNLSNADTAGLEDEFYGDGRVAFFAKGKVKGEWLLTASVDSGRDTRLQSNKVNQLIDPNTYYTIYGDATRQKREASSADKIYIKIERDRFYAVYGDMRTELNDSELSRYERNMTGFKSEYENGDLSFNVFMADDSNIFFKDEIPGDGTSGLYRLSNNNLVLNSETVTIETRERFRNEIIVDSKTLQRHVDYSIDYQTGELFFREPISSRDPEFNPIIIVVDYEVVAPVKGKLTYGGRGAVKVLDDRLEIGVSGVRDSTFANETSLVGVDATLDVTKNTQVKVEMATSNGEKSGVPADGKAILAEVQHEAKDLRVRAYVRKQDAGFGVGQQSRSLSGTSKVGVDATYRVDNEMRVDAEVYHEENLLTNVNRDVVSTTVEYKESKYSVSAGARMAKDTDNTGAVRQSDLLLLGATRKLADGQVLLRANSEISLGNDQNVAYPSRYILGADYFITPAVNLYAENEWTFGGLMDTQLSRMGVRASPWAGAQVNSSINREVQENGIRSFATLGLTQGFQINERWSADVTFDRSETLKGTNAPLLNNNVTPVQGTFNADFTAISVGATYRGDNYTLVNRFEQRNSDVEHKTGAVVRWERNTIEGLGYSISTELFDASRSDGSQAMDLDLRLSVGFRPFGSKWIVLNKSEYILNDKLVLITGRQRQTKLIDNLVINYAHDTDNQLSVNYGIKLVQDSFDGADYDGWTQLLGTQYRHDLSETTDYGLQAFTHYSANSGTLQYSLGASFGWNMARNIWLSVGYNIEGFSDADFSAAGYTAQGPYMNFRLKFDQDTAKEIQNWLN